jgi:hypothetical protein
MWRQGICIAAAAIVTACAHASTRGGLDEAGPVPLVLGVRNSLPEGFRVLEVLIEVDGQEVLDAQAQGTDESWEPAIEQGATRVVRMGGVWAGHVTVHVRARLSGDSTGTRVLELTKTIEVTRAVLVELLEREGQPHVHVGKVGLPELEGDQTMCVEPGTGAPSEGPGC